MSEIKRVKTIHLTQEKDRNCGPTCSSMVLSSLGQPNSTRPDQNVLAPYVNNAPGPLKFGNPDGVALAINAFRKPYPGLFEPRPSGSPDCTSQSIAEALYSFPAAVPAMVSHCDHWVVVTAVQTDVKISPGVKYTIEMFCFFDPGDPSTAAEDGPENWVPYTEWIKTHLNGCKLLSPKPYVAVTDTRLEVSGHFQPASLALLPIRSETLIGPTIAVEAALRGMQLYNIPSVEGYRVQSSPLLVQRIDYEDEYYYLVPLIHSNGGSAIARVDALDERFLGIQLRARDFPYRTPAAFAELLATDREPFVDLPRHLRPGTYVVHPVLVWRPCKRTRSPFQPLYQLDRGGAIGYVDRHFRYYEKID